jgi:DNA-binding LytR/AlgR family response regulator
MRHVKDLVFLEGCVNYTWQWSDGWRILLPRMIKHIMDKLPPAYFLRLHRQFAVNRLFVDQSQILSDASKVFLTTAGICLPVSPQRKSQISHQLRENADLPTVGM